MSKGVKYLLLTLGAAAVIGGIYFYDQYKRLMDYCISLKKIKLNRFTKTQADIDMVLYFVNKSALNITLYSQEYNVYLNDAFVTKVSNAVQQQIKANTTSELAVKLQFNPTAVLQVAAANIVDLLTKQDNVNVTISSKLTVGTKGIKFNIPYDYKTTLKELMASEEPNGSAPKC